MITCFSPVSAGGLRCVGLPDDARGITAGYQTRLRSRTTGGESVDPDVTVEMNLLLYASYFGITRAEARARATALLEFTALTEKASARIDTLSGA